MPDRREQNVCELGYHCGCQSTNGTGICCFCDQQIGISTQANDARTIQYISTPAQQNVARNYYTAQQQQNASVQWQDPISPFAANNIWYDWLTQPLQEAVPEVMACEDDGSEEVKG